MRAVTFCSTAVSSPRSASPVPPPPSTKPSSPLYKISTATVGQEFWFAVSRSVASLVNHYVVCLYVGMYVCLYVCMCVRTYMYVCLLVSRSQTTSSPLCGWGRVSSLATQDCMHVSSTYVVCCLCFCVDCVCIPHNTPTISHVLYVCSCTGAGYLHWFSS